MDISFNPEGKFEDLPSQIVCPNGLKFNYNYNQTGNLSEVTIGDERKIKIDYDEKGRIVGYSYFKN
jgi:hypothetical protein